MQRAARLPASAMVLSALLACGEAPDCDPCGTMITVVTADADVLVPAFTESTIGQQIGDLLFWKLADLGLELNTLGDSGFIPRLARSWKFEDSLTISFDMDPRARWQDGAPVTAGDVAWTFSVYQDPASRASLRTYLGEIASVTARDERTAVFRFRRYYAEQFYDATHHMRILPRHLLDSIPHDRLASHSFMRHPVGNGPYRFVAWTPSQAVELAADTAFFLGRPGLARVIWSIAPDFETAITRLVSGEADFMEYLGGPEGVARADAASQLRVIEYMSPAYVYLGLNLWDPERLSRPHPILGNRELRRALTQAVDRRTLREAIVGRFGKPALGPTSRMTAIGNDSTLPRLPWDTAATNAALERLGWKDTDGDGIRERNGERLRLEMIVPASSAVRLRAATNLQQQFQRVGVELALSRLDLNQVSSRTRKRDFDVAMITWNDDPSPSSIRQTFVSQAIGDVNYVGYSNPRFDRLVQQAVYAPDAATALEHYHDAFTIIIEDAPGIWLWNPIQPAGIHRRLENVTIRPDQWSATLWTWRVKPGEMIARDRVAAPSPPTP